MIKISFSRHFFAARQICFHDLLVDRYSKVVNSKYDGILTAIRPSPVTGLWKCVNQGYDAPQSIRYT